MSRAHLFQKSASGRSPSRCLITFDVNEKPNNYYFYAKSPIVNNEVDITLYKDSSRFQLAVLHVAPWAVVLECFSEIYVEAQGWGLKADSGIHLTGASAAQGSLIYLRPDDIIQIGKARLELKRDSLEPPENPEVQVTSSGCNEEKDNERETKIQPLKDPYPSLDQLVSTPGFSHDIDTTIMETPAASNNHGLYINGSPVRSTVIQNPLTSDDDKHKTKKSKFAANHASTGRALLAQDMVENLYTNDDYANVPPLFKGNTKHVLSPALANQVAEPFHHDKVLKPTVEIPMKSSAERKTLRNLPTTISAKNSRKRVKNSSQDSTTNIVNEEASSSARTDASKAQAPVGKVSEEHNNEKTDNQTKDVSASTPSNSSTRSGLRGKSNLLQFSSQTRVFFANSTSVNSSTKSMKQLNSQGLVAVISVPDCDVLCIGKGDLKKTPNLIMAVIYGKQVVKEDWIKQSMAKSELLDYSDFLASDPANEAEWGFNLSEAIQRGRNGVKPLLDYNIYFTSAARNELGKRFDSFKNIAKCAGAKSVITKLPDKAEPPNTPKTIIIATQHDGYLSGLESGGWKAFSKDIVTLSILRGVLDLDSDEFLVRRD